MLLVSTLVAVLVAIPECAMAWGPVTHLAHGSLTLAALNTLPSGLQLLLGRYPLAYLYGCVGADITVGKKYTRAQQAHCHSWTVGWQIYEAAQSERERAFAFGYLTHLASDVFSHNHFVPTQLVVSYRSRALRHVYWEARFDSAQPAEFRQLVSRVRRQRFPDCDRLFQRVVARTLFSFRTNKRIFDSVLAFHDWENWYQLIERVAGRSRYELPPDVVVRYNAACEENILDLLRRRKRAACQRADPTGLQALKLASRVRSTLRRLESRHSISPELTERLRALNLRTDFAASAVAVAVAAAPG